ncbi:MAG: hypothetical protein M9962_03220 [Oligoflexia bacterium]|nr:hypothetical protein [Oligoflexia bacterium]
MIKALLFLIPLFLHPTYSVASEEITRNFQNGHNLSATSDLLEQGQCTLGLTLIACGIGSRVSLGTSSWMYYDYNMVSAALRILLSENEGDRWALQIDYFDTYKKRELNLEGLPTSVYEMQALWLMLIRTYKFNEHYRLHVNLHTNYYFNEKLPFSLRRPYLKPVPVQVNATLLHEIQLVSDWYVLGEMGFLDLINKPIHIHSGASLGKSFGKHITAHIGFSLSSTFDALFSPVQRRDYQQILRYSDVEGYSSVKDPYLVQYDYSLHPEFELQILF